MKPGARQHPDRLPDRPQEARAAPVVEDQSKFEPLMMPRKQWKSQQEEKKAEHQAVEWCELWSCQKCKKMVNNSLSSCDKCGAYKLRGLTFFSGKILSLLSI